MKKDLTFLLTVFLFSLTVNAQHYRGGLLVGQLPLATPSLVAAPCDTTFSFSALVAHPSGLATDGTGIWVSSYSVNYLSKFSATGVLLDTLWMPSSIASLPGGDLDFDGTNLLYCVEDIGMLFKINLTTRTIVAQYPLPDYTSIDPQDFGIAFDGTYIWHSVYLPTNTLYKLDASNGTVLASYPVPGSSGLLPLKFINGSLYGINIASGLLMKFSTTNGSILSSTTWCLTYPLGLLKYAGHVWGIASTPVNRIYEFNNLITGAYFPEEETAFSFNFNNPVDDKLMIQSGLNDEAANIKIVDMQGRVVHEKNVKPFESIIEMDLQQLNSGVYNVQYQSGRSAVTRKMLKL